MNVLIVHAHQEPKSFNGAMTDVAVKALTEAGHAVVVSDLYASGFVPVAGRHDFVAVHDPDYFKYQAEQRASWQDAGYDGFAGPVATEMRRVADCDLMIWQFPLWWFGLPAILKGWVDRVMAVGFSYGGGRWFETAPLVGRRAILSLTTGGRADRFGPDRLMGDLMAHLRPIHMGILNFCGFDVLEPFVAYAAASVDDAQRKHYLDDWARRLPGLFDETPLPFHRVSDFADPEHRDQ